MRRGPYRVHLPSGNLDRRVITNQTRLARLVGAETIDDIRDKRLDEARAEFQRELQASIDRKKAKEQNMTVSLYSSSASGQREIVVQTNAQSLDVFISGLSDALDAAISAAPEASAQTIAATLKNAFPVAFAIAGYKAEKVSESKLLTCGFASPDASELVAQSKV